MTVDLNNDLERAKVLARINEDVDTFCRAEFAEDPRTHLGASIIGHDCKAYAWSVFRWLKFEELTGQMYRLLNRGHEEEARFVRWLNGIGFQVQEFADPVARKQFRIIGAKDHFGGSLDSLMKAPDRYGLPDNLVWLGEFKTHNEKNFTKLAGPKPAWRDLKAGKMRSGGLKVRRSKPQHFKQMCSYGRAYALHWGLYCAVNKDTDELYFEIVKLDWLEADDLFRKAEEIVFSPVRPAKIANTPAFHECKLCIFSNLCHSDEVPTKNCRSCKFAVPIESAQWRCTHPANPDAPLPKEVIMQGCGYWVRIV